jgi:hypothetical protein
MSSVASNIAVSAKRFHHTARGVGKRQHKLALSCKGGHARHFVVEGFEGGTSVSDAPNTTHAALPRGGFVATERGVAPARVRIPPVVRRHNHDRVLIMIRKWQWDG